MINDKNTQLIRKHLQGNLTDEEERLFRRRLKDPEFRKELALHAGLKAVFAKEDREKRQEVNSFLQTLDTKDTDESKGGGGKIRRLSTRWWMGVAAAVAIVIVAILGIIELFPEGEAVQITEAEKRSFYTSYRMPEGDAKKGLENNQGNEDSVSAIRNCQELLNTGSFEEGIDCLERIDISPSEEWKVKYLLGDAYFKRGREGDYKRALSYFEESLDLFPAQPPKQNDIDISKEDIKWNRMIVLWIMENSSFRSLLDSFYNEAPESKYRRNTERILESLE